MNKLKKVKNIYKAVAVFLAVMMFSSAVFANSAPIEIVDGDTNYGILPREETPLEVLSELLTFDINRLYPEEDFYDLEDAADYSGTVTAAYHFKNTSNNTVTAKLAFAQGFNRLNGACQVKLNDTVLDTKIRYTYCRDEESFSGPKDVKLILDSFQEDEFFSPSMTVTEYTFNIPDVSEDTARFNCSIEGSKTRLLLPCKINWVDPYSKYIKKNASEKVYVFGDAKKAELSLSIGEALTIKPEKTKEMKLSDFARMCTSNAKDIKETDSFNAVVKELNENMIDNVIFSQLTEDSIPLTMWIEYEFTLKPEEEAVNTVKAVLAPRIYNYRNVQYTYTYLLSPAQCWKSFGSLDVVINTPYKLDSINIGSNEKTEDGYTVHFDTLPESELKFSFKEESSDKKSFDFMFLLVILYALVRIGLIGFLAVFIVTSVIALLTGKKKKGKKN